MFRRWFIRSCYTTLLLLCVGLWVRTYSFNYYTYYRHGDESLRISAIDGLLCFDLGYDLTDLQKARLQEGIHFGRDPESPYVNAPFDYVAELRSITATHYFLGFIV